MTSRHKEDVLPELARFINVWIERDLSPTPTAALSHWVRQTAARCSRLPRPDLALPLLTELGLAHTASAGGVIEPNAELLRDRAAGTLALDRYPTAIAMTVFDRLLRVPDFSGALRHVLSFASLSGGSLIVSWNEVPRKEQQSPGWIWLQQLGLMSHADDRVLLDPALRPFVLEAPETRRRMSQAELEERLRCRQERAALAEEYVLAAERVRLRVSGAESLAAEVVRVSIEDVMAGFDIRSFESAERFGTSR